MAGGPRLKCGRARVTVDILDWFGTVDVAPVQMSDLLLVGDDQRPLVFGFKFGCSGVSATSATPVAGEGIVTADSSFGSTTRGVVYTFGRGNVHGYCWEHRDAIPSFSIVCEEHRRVALCHTICASIYQ